MCIRDRRTGAAGGDSANALFWTPFAFIVLALDEGVAAGLRAWCEAEEAGADPDALALAAALALDAATAEAEGGAPARTGAPEGMRQDGAEALASVARFVHARLEAAEGRAADLFLAAATAALGRAGEEMCIRDRRGRPPEGRRPLRIRGWCRAGWRPASTRSARAPRRPRSPAPRSPRPGAPARPACRRCAGTRARRSRAGLPAPCLSRPSWLLTRPVRGISCT